MPETRPGDVREAVKRISTTLIDASEELDELLNAVETGRVYDVLQVCRDIVAVAHSHLTLAESLRFRMAEQWAGDDDGHGNADD